MLEHSSEQLVLDAANAKAYSVSYGQYIAMKREGRVKPLHKDAQKLIQKKQQPSGKLCRRCGRPVSTDRGRSAYCSDQCRDDNNREMSRASQRKRYHKKKEMIMAGDKQLTPKETS